MILRYEYLQKSPHVFKSMAGLTLVEFEATLAEVEPLLEISEWQRLNRPDRQRDIGGGTPHTLGADDQILLTIVWLRTYPCHEVLGYLFGVSDSTVWRVIHRVLPLLEQAGRDSLRMPDPGKKGRRSLDELLQDTPELAVLVDSFEQRVQRPPDQTEQKAHFSGKKKCHTLKSQVAVNEETGEIVAVSDSVPGPTADIKLFEQSKVAEAIPTGVGVIGDSGYQGIEAQVGEGNGATPRKKPRNQPRPEADRAYNTALARRRVTVENTIGRMRRYQAITQTDREHRCHHTSRVLAISGLVNRQIRHRFPT